MRTLSGFFFAPFGLSTGIGPRPFRPHAARMATIRQAGHVHFAPDSGDIPLGQPDAIGFSGVSGCPLPRTVSTTSHLARPLRERPISPPHAVCPRLPRRPTTIRHLRCIDCRPFGAPSGWQTQRAPPSNLRGASPEGHVYCMKTERPALRPMPLERAPREAQPKARRAPRG